MMTNKMDKLNLPLAPLNIDTKGHSPRVLDPLRRRFVTLTPEEWVRQHFVHYLIAHKGYPAGLMGNEVSITLNDTARRCDTVVYDRHGEPWMIVEYKAASVAITQEVFEQILRYNIVLRAPFLTVSNGLQTYCCAIDHATGRHTFLNDLPEYK